MKVVADERRNTVSDWEQHVRDQLPAVLRIAQRILGHIADAEDVTQDVFCEAWRIRKSKQIENWSGLLRHMAVMRSLDRLRSRRPMQQLRERSHLNDHEGPVEQAIARELADRLRHAISRLPPQQAAAFSLCYFEQMDRHAIAQLMETSAGAISAALSKARRQIASELVLQSKGDSNECI